MKDPGLLVPGWALLARVAAPPMLTRDEPTLETLSRTDSHNSSDTHSDLHSELHPDSLSDVHPDVHPDVRPESRSEPHSDSLLDLHSDLHSGPRSDSLLDPYSDSLSDIRPDSLLEFHLDTRSNPQLVRPTGEMCSPEGQWNCMTTSWQRCASGMWSAVIPCAAGTICQPVGLTDFISIEYDPSAIAGHGDNGHASDGKADGGRDKSGKKNPGIRNSPGLVLLAGAVVSGISWSFLV
ncbi:hypothetical protein V8C34DRAFT_44389 [Trichoderma compactum]